MNKNRTIPKPLQANDTIYRKENRRNKITPRFTKQEVKIDNGVTFITNKNQKIHKSKIRTKLKLNKLYNIKSNELLKKNFIYNLFLGCP